MSVRAFWCRKLLTLIDWQFWERVAPLRNSNMTLVFSCILNDRVRPGPYCSLSHSVLSPDSDLGPESIKSWPVFGRLHRWPLHQALWLLKYCSSCTSRIGPRIKRWSIWFEVKGLLWQWWYLSIHKLTLYSFLQYPFKIIRVPPYLQDIFLAPGWPYYADFSGTAWVSIM